MRQTCSGIVQVAGAKLCVMIAATPIPTVSKRDQTPIEIVEAELEHGHERQHMPVTGQERHRLQSQGTATSMERCHRAAWCPREPTPSAVI